MRIEVWWASCYDNERWLDRLMVVSGAFLAGCEQ
jgi:hypothetical protein